MGREHIDFANWEPDGPLDEEHLKTCASCREELELARFLRAQVTQVPGADVPPFFAARVSHLAGASASPDAGSFWALVEASAKRLMPAFTVLVLILLFFSSETQLHHQPSDEELWAALFVEPQISEVETLDDVLLSLHETVEEESEGRY